MILSIISPVIIKLLKKYWSHALLVILVLIYICSVSKPKEVLNLNHTPKVDSIRNSATNTVSEVSKSTYKNLNDEDSKKIKADQKELGISTNRLLYAGSVKSNTSDSVITKTIIKHDTIYSDSIHHICDDIRTNYQDEWTKILVRINTCSPDSTIISYSINNDYTLFIHTEYKHGSWFLPRLWNKIFHVGKHVEYTIKSNNPHQRIDKIQVIKMQK